MARKKIIPEIEDNTSIPVEPIPDAENEMKALLSIATEDDRYRDIEIKEGRVLLEEIETDKPVPGFIIVNSLKVKQQPGGYVTVNGYIRNGESIKYRVIKKKNQQ